MPTLTQHNEQALRIKKPQLDDPIVINTLTDQTGGHALGIEANVLGTDEIICAFYARDIAVRKDFHPGDYFKFIKTPEQRRRDTMFTVCLKKKDRVVLPKGMLSAYRDIIFYIHPVSSNKDDILNKVLPKPLYELVHQFRVEQDRLESKIVIMEKTLNRVEDLTESLLSLGGFNDKALAKIQEIAGVVQQISKTSEASSSDSKDKDKTKK